jgi:hypothetical protein
MLIKDAFVILAAANDKIAELGVSIIDKVNTPKEQRYIQQLNDVASLYNIAMEYIILNDDGDAISGVKGTNDAALNKILYQLKRVAQVETSPAILPNPIHSYVSGFNSQTGQGFPVGQLGDLLYYETGWDVLSKGSDGDVLVSTSSGLQWQNVVGNGIPSGGSGSQFLIKNSGTDYDAVWASMTLSRVSDVAASAAELNKLDGAQWSTAESNALVGINTSVTIQAQLDDKVSTTLTNGNFLVGNGSNVATSVTPTGDVTFTNAGVFAIGAGVIVDADINAAAGITRSKLATGTAYRVITNSSLGVISEAGAITGSRVLISDANGVPTNSTITSTTLAFLDASSSIQTQLNARLEVNLGTEAQGDILYFNGTDWVNLAVGTVDQVLTTDGTTVSWGDLSAQGVPTAGTTAQFLVKASDTNFDTEWHSFLISDIPGLTASAAELNILSGATLTTTELNFVDGVTSNIQTQLGNKLNNSLAYNAIWVGNGANLPYPLAAGTDGYVLMVVGGVPTWQDPTPPGDVSGVAPSVDNAIVRWNGILGNSIQNSGVVIDDSDGVTGATGFELINQGVLTLKELTANGVHYIGLRAYDTMAASYTITFPAAAPSANTYLKYDGTNYSWTSAMRFRGAYDASSNTLPSSDLIAGDMFYISVAGDLDPGDGTGVQLVAATKVIMYVSTGLWKIFG